MLTLTRSALLLAALITCLTSLACTTTHSTNSQPIANRDFTDGGLSTQ